MPRRRKSGNYTTERQYAAAHRAFRTWCYDHRVPFPPSYKNVANYLYHCVAERGASVAVVHLSAISRLYHDLGKRLDTKAPAIQQVIASARAELRLGSSGTDIRLRVPAQMKQTIEQAAATRGVTVRDFMLSAAYHAAEKIIQSKRQH